MPRFTSSPMVRDVLKSLGQPGPGDMQTISGMASRSSLGTGTEMARFVNKSQKEKKATNGIMGRGRGGVATQCASCPLPQNETRMSILDVLMHAVSGMTARRKRGLGSGGTSRMMHGRVSREGGSKQTGPHAQVEAMAHGANVGARLPQVVGQRVHKRVLVVDDEDAVTRTHTCRRWQAIQRTGGGVRPSQGVQERLAATRVEAAAEGTRVR